MSREVYLINGYSERLSAAIMFYSPDGCADYGSWGTRGWWNIEPGASSHVLNTDNRYFAFYAEAADGRLWAGDRGPVYVHQTSFDSCIGIGDNNPDTRVVGMCPLDLDVNTSWRLT